ncbi:hypothetical protein BKA63DRAFT_446111 [Paraphoma chrysanthemicola]|nr:hypothetical protein BKA63DRAFT_446111 [Paraphoma chrysanthemicola]
MSSKAFEAALRAPDTHSSNTQLYTLITAADFSGSSLPRVAEEFLLAFCDPTLSHIRRRWVGLAFAGMLSTSPQVVKHITAMKQKLHGLGEVIIGTDEREETRIIAGIIIREALAQRFDFASFWSSDKVRNSASIFPSDFDWNWMDKFQGFMDNLDALALANPVTDPCILYAISLEGSSSFRWAHSEGAMLVSIIQSDALTIIMPGDLPHAVQFLDIPVSHIQTTNSHASAPLADSQARTTEHEPWDLVLKLNNGSWTHLVNSAKSKASQITILFEKAGNARECEAALKELQGATAGASGPSTKTSMKSSSSLGSRILGQGSGIPEDPLDGSDGLLSNADSTHISLRDVARSQGKLPKVSQATKQRASQQLLEQSDIFEMPIEHNKKPRTRNEVGKGAGASTQPTARMPKPTAATNIERANQGRQTRSKRKADTDHDFVPSRHTGGNRGTKRKDPTTAADSAGRSSKKPRRMEKSSKSQESREPSSSILSTRTPLIGGLLGVQKPSQVPKAAFRKPPLPPRSPLPPSTPSQRRSRPRPSTIRPRTPNVRGLFQDSAMPAIRSSPPPISVTETESTSAHHGITETEILSSNSKPVPASPHAESMAISGHADGNDIDLEKVEADMQTAKLNPFAQARDNYKSTSFIRRLTGDVLYLDRPEPVDDLTLINDDSEVLQLNGQDSQLRFRTDPPPPDAPSSHSSTSAESESSSQPPVPTSEAEELEWEASLQPHQRALHDLLIKVSNRVLRHIVDNETAAADIAGDFANDSQHLLHEVLKRHNAAYAEVREDMETKRTTLRKELQKSAKSLAKERKRVSAVV